MNWYWFVSLTYGYLLKIASSYCVKLHIIRTEYLVGLILPGKLNLLAPF